MINRYCMIQFIEAPDPDNVSIMHPMENGNWVKHEEAQVKIDLAIDVFKSLKEVSLHNTNPEQLNMIVDRAIIELSK